MDPTSLGPSRSKLLLVLFPLPDPSNLISLAVNSLLSMPNLSYNVFKSLGNSSLGVPALAFALATKSCSYFSPSFPPLESKILTKPSSVSN